MFKMTFPTKNLQFPQDVPLLLVIRPRWLRLQQPTQPQSHLHGQWQMWNAELLLTVVKKLCCPLGIEQLAIENGPFLVDLPTQTG